MIAIRRAVLTVRRRPVAAVAHGLHHDPPIMLEITEPARRLIREAARRGRVLVVSAPWPEYGWNGALFAAWRRDGEHAGLDGCVRIGDGEWVYLRADLVPAVRRRHLRLERHSVLGLWPGIAVRELEPVPVRATDRAG